MHEQSIKLKNTAFARTRPREAYLNPRRATVILYKSRSKKDAKIPLSSNTDFLTAIKSIKNILI